MWMITFVIFPEKVGELFGLGQQAIDKITKNVDDNIFSNCHMKENIGNMNRNISDNLIVLTHG